MVISDQDMPDNLGTDFLQQVRAFSPSTRCAILTAYPEGGKPFRGLDQGLFLMIPKPLNIDDLKRTIRELLQDRGQR